MIETLTPGTRVMLSALALNKGISKVRDPFGEVKGTVLRITRRGTVAVRWDDVKTESVYHPKFLQVI